MTDQHPITPPPELVQQWLGEHFGVTVTGEVSVVEQHIATQAARWGADQELEACIEWITGRDWTWTSSQLREARRPKPPSLKEQALQALYRFDDTEGHEGLTQEQIAEDYVIIRRALEALPDD